jgi:hypothetical protein
MTESEKKTQSVIRSFRIPKALDRQLREIAQERRTSVNALAEAVLQKFADFDTHAEEFGYGVVKKGFLVKVFEGLTDQQVRDLGDWAGRGLGSETVRYYHPEVDLEAVFSTFEDIWSRYSGMYSFRHEVRNNQHILLLNHNMGMKWSLFYEAQMKALFDKNLGLKLETELSPNFVTARFKMR